MSLLEILLLALALAADAFSIGAAVGLNHRAPRQYFRLSFHFGLFQSIFSFSGIMAGNVILIHIKAWDHWIAFSILTAIGLKMMYESFQEESRDQDTDLTRGFIMIGLSTAVSIDALAAGVGLSAAEAPVTISVTLIGVVAAAATFLAMIAANRIKCILGRRCEFIGGLVLITIGTRMLLSHLGIISF